MDLFPAKIITFPPPDITHLHISTQNITCFSGQQWLTQAREYAFLAAWQPRGSEDEAVVDAEGTLCLPEDWIQMGGELLLASA